ncbi:MAG: hypothetical protein AAF694_14435 [Bacteroidota bacterium]
MNPLALQKNKFLLVLLLVGGIMFSCSSPQEEVSESIPKKDVYIFVDSYHLKADRILELQEELMTCLERQKNKAAVMDIKIFPLNCETINSQSLVTCNINQAEATQLKKRSSNTYKKVKGRWKEQTENLQAQDPGCVKIIDSFYKLKSLLHGINDTSRETKVLYITNWLEIDSENNVTEDQYRFIGSCSGGICEFDEAGLDEAMKSLDKVDSKLYHYTEALYEFLADSQKEPVKIYHIPSNSIQLNKDGDTDLKNNRFWDEAFKRAHLKRVQINSIAAFLES